MAPGSVLRWVAALVLGGLGATACTVPPEDVDPSGHASSASSPALGGAASASSCSGQKAAPAEPRDERLSSSGLTLSAFAELLRDGAIDYAEGEGIGWAIDLISGGANDERSMDEIKEEINRTNDELAQLNSTLDALCEQMTKDFVEIERHEDFSDFQQSLASADKAVNDLQTNSLELNIMLSRPAGGLLDQDKDDLVAMRDDARHDIDVLGEALYPTDASGKQGVLRAYAKMLELNMTNPPSGSTPVSPPSANHLYGNAYMDPMQNLVDYYTGIMLSTLDLLSESFHADFTTADGKHYTTDKLTVQSEVPPGPWRHQL